MSGYQGKLSEVQQGAVRANAEMVPVRQGARDLVSVPKTAGRIITAKGKGVEEAGEQKRLCQKYGKELKSLAGEIKNKRSAIGTCKNGIIDKLLKACEGNKELESEAWMAFQSDKLPELFQGWVEKLEELEKAFENVKGQDVSSEQLNQAVEQARKEEKEKYEKLRKSRQQYYDEEAWEAEKRKEKVVKRKYELKKQLKEERAALWKQEREHKAKVSEAEEVKSTLLKQEEVLRSRISDLEKENAEQKATAARSKSLLKQEMMDLRKQQEHELSMAQAEQDLKMADLVAERNGALEDAAELRQQLGDLKVELKDEVNKEKTHWQQRMLAERKVMKDELERIKVREDRRIQEQVRALLAQEQEKHAYELEGFNQAWRALLDTAENQRAHEVRWKNAARRKVHRARTVATMKISHIQRRAYDEKRDTERVAKSKRVYQNLVVEGLRKANGNMVVEVDSQAKKHARSLSVSMAQVEAKKQKVESLEKTRDYEWSLAGSFWADLREKEKLLEEVIQSRDDNCSRADKNQKMVEELEDALEQVTESWDDICSHADRLKEELAEVTKDRDDNCSRVEKSAEEIDDLKRELEEMTRSRDGNCSRATMFRKIAFCLVAACKKLTQSRDDNCSRAEKSAEEIQGLKQDLEEMTRSRDNNCARAKILRKMACCLAAAYKGMTISRDDNCSRAVEAEKKVSEQAREIAGLKKAQRENRSQLSRYWLKTLRLIASGRIVAQDRDTLRDRAEQAEQKVAEQAGEIVELKQSRDGHSARSRAFGFMALRLAVRCQIMTRSRDENSSRAKKYSRMVIRMGVVSQKLSHDRYDNGSRAEKAEGRVSTLEEQVRVLTQDQDAKGEEIKRLGGILMAIAPTAKSLEVEKFGGVMCNTAEWLQRIPGMHRGASGEMVALNMIRGNRVGLTELVGAVRAMEGDERFFLAAVLSFVKRGGGGLLRLRCLELLQMHGQDISEFLAVGGNELEAGLLQMLRGGRLEVQSRLSRCGQGIVLKVDGGVRFCWLDTIRVTRVDGKWILEGKDGQGMALSLKEANQFGQWFPEVMQGYGRFIDITE